MSEDYGGIAVWWQDVSIPVHPGAGVEFTLTVAWKENAESPCVASIVASDATQLVISHASVLIEKEAAAAAAPEPKPEPKTDA